MLRFKIGDCQVCISASFFALVTFILAVSDGEIALISLFSSFLHESGHIAAMLILGDRIDRLSFTAVGIRLDKGRERAVSYNDEILISLAGIAVNLILCAAFGSAYLYTDKLLLRNIGIVNFLVAAFNLLPVEPLDGARALYYALLKRTSPERADTIVVYASVITVMLVIAGVFAATFYSGTNFSLMIAIIYLLVLLINHIFRLYK